VRGVTSAERAQIYAGYGAVDVRGAGEVDHSSRSNWAALTLARRSASPLYRRVIRSLPTATSRAVLLHFTGCLLSKRENSSISITSGCASGRGLTPRRIVLSQSK
jgi:hypothetical protein